MKYSVSSTMASQTFSFTTFASNNATPAGNATRCSKLSTCPSSFAESVIGMLLTTGIIISNIACVKLKLSHETQHHPENRYYIINLAISNIFCGVALFFTNMLDMFVILNVASLDLQICFAICMFWAPIHIYCVMTPYVAIATLGIDIAHYCHRSIGYHRRMSRATLLLTVASSWIYTLLIVCVTFAARPKILCDQDNWQMDILFIIFPIFLMLLPALCVVVTFFYIIRSYWRASNELVKKLNLPKIGRENDTKRKLITKFMKKFLHLIVFSILCSLVFTFFTILEAVVENQTDKRYCEYYLLMRISTSLNSLLSPWLYCLGKEHFRNRMKRHLQAWWHNNSSIHAMSSKTASRVNKNKSGRLADATFADHNPRQRELVLYSTSKV